MKYVYAFHEGSQDMRDLLGGKGANLAEMTRISLPVPKGFTVTTEACLKYYQNQESLNADIISEIYEKINELERLSGKKMGDPSNPLLVSVRSGSRVSMPGMMDTILNLGMNDVVAEGFSKISSNPRFVYDNYRRLIQMYADVVMGFPKSSFEHLFDKIKEEKNVTLDTELTADDLKEIVEIYKVEYLKYAGSPFPDDPKVQLVEAVKAVFRSWNNERAVTYRKLNEIPDSYGTAVNVQEMVYGNRGENSGTGVAFTRNPSSGEHQLYGEYLMNAQGEDVVAGIRTPKSIETLKDVMPDCYYEFERICEILEEHYKDMQDMEFTIEEGKLFMLQTRSGKRTGQAALKIAVDMVNEGKISKEEALLRVDEKQIDQLLHPTFDKSRLSSKQVIAEGLAASPGAATGKIYFTAGKIEEAYKNGERELILVREETSPEDISGMHLAKGVLTVRGGMTSHAAVVARGMGTCCVSGCGSARVDMNAKTLTFASVDTVFHEGDYISLDGSTGYVYGEKIETVNADVSSMFSLFMSWADEYRRLKIRVNADTPKDAIEARKLGAEGIGLCRTEHMFFEESRIFYFRQMILADTLEKRQSAICKILPFQREDFEGLFQAMDGETVVIRLLDPPLHEFLPHTPEEISALASSLLLSSSEVEARIDSLKEFNPMMGHRGCRLAISYPEIAKMQTCAIIEALIKVEKEGVKTNAEIMIPLVGKIEEYRYVKSIILDTAKEVMDEAHFEVSFKIGTMIEVPRAVLIADTIAKEADFFSFGTNDLTQMTFGFSRDDASKFLDDYYAKGIFLNDPFKTIDTQGVGRLVHLGSSLARYENENIELGICGEHGGDMKSIEFFHKVGLDYVSCSPYRVPIARLAAAQASIKANQSK